MLKGSFCLLPNSRLCCRKMMLTVSIMAGPSDSAEMPEAGEVCVCKGGQLQCYGCDLLKKETSDHSLPPF